MFFIQEHKKTSVNQIKDCLAQYPLSSNGCGQEQCVKLELTHPSSLQQSLTGRQDGRLHVGCCVQSLLTALSSVQLLCPFCSLLVHIARKWVIVSYSILYSSHSLLDLSVLTTAISKVNSNLCTLSSHLNWKTHPSHTAGFHTVCLYSPFHLKLTTEPTSCLSHLESPIPLFLKFCNDLFEVTSRRCVYTSCQSRGKFCYLKLPFFCHFPLCLALTQDIITLTDTHYPFLKLLNFWSWT